MFGYFKRQGAFVEGNSIHLMENGEKFFPQLIRRIKHAKCEVFLETFILENDRIGRAIKRAILLARKRGAWVSLTVDSWGSHYLDPEFIEELTAAGVVFQIYDPQPSWYKGRPKLFRRLHRKLVCVDGKYAMIGGINYCNDHMVTSGPGAKQDYAVELQGPIIASIRQLCKSYVRDARDERLKEVEVWPPERQDRGHKISFISRDNRHNRRRIEKAYLTAIAQAKTRIWIANAYFFPSYRFVRALIKAQQRGVDVRLVIQGDPDIPFSLSVARALYDLILRNKIKLYEFRERPLHAKIAVVDDHWSTIGSSNLDPLSLAFNLEANILVKSKEFNKELARKIDNLVSRSVPIEQSWVKHRRWYWLVKDFFTFHVLRWFPTISGLFPAHTPLIRELKRDHDTGNGRSKDSELDRKFPESKGAKRVVNTTEYLSKEEIEL
ncbi:cardiolipin synthase ClsB [Gilvimarinus agarilyticus]|uniref:cardiolipin synthase ClsB n=1 Tax=unclassified Gilvimarinus TaxID=2642066 RepID=UPI001C0880FE|nr:MULTISPECIES: cardiolipin synthase ClsB [unclassified Gilvimarinus]MBU2886268.1 cardiolipin synthase ClsB [Gilvimarinus agarilyticus]MDO6570956.1 cardiolipin synthase ClsB [Gilvimarinus sp. 2_MG-2023]MDO6747757.1 cardiolipin synthase ClsB [Gilvimarinus sp. 1_MG-2023]